MSEKSLSRRSFLQWSALGAGAIGASGLVACASGDGAGEGGDSLAETGLTETGEWKNAPCYNNCSCGSSRCLNRVYVEDGVPLKMRSDEAEEDSYAVPQRRSCLRGRAKIGEVYSPARIKYPMKRKNFSLDNPQGELRGRDEWERMSWEDALDLVAEGIKKMIDKYGSKGILCGGSTNISDGYYDQNVCLLDALGGSVHHEAGTVSYGSWAVADTHILGGSLNMTNTPHHLQMVTSDLHVMFGCNWAANKAGNHTWFMHECRKRGAKVIIIDPWLNQTAQAIADEWIPILPGTDTALVIAICHEWINAGTFDQEFLDKYCVGFDEKTMPATAPANASWKDYVMGTGYDMTPKTPEWAEAICGVPADKIRELAAEIAAVDKVDFFASQSTSKIPAGEQFVQSFYTMALMHGGVGTPGHYFGWSGIKDFTSSMVMAGAYCPVDADPVNPLMPEGAPVFMFYPIPVFDKLGDKEWLNLEPSECWRSIKAGEYGRDCWPGGKIKLDIHAAYFGGHMSTLNQIADTMTGIEVVRGFDFVWGVNPFFDSTRQYCDVVLPCATFWEKPNKAFFGDASSVLWFDQILEPLYEAKYESWIAEELAGRLGLDPKVVNTMTDAERTYATVRDGIFMDGTTYETSPLLTITQEEVDTYFPGTTGQPQEGKFTFQEFREKGILKAPLTEDMFVPEPWMAFINDPEGAPLATASGKFEIYCETLAYMVNSVGYSQIAPIGMYQIGDPEQGAGTQTDAYPLLLWTPHSLRRAHSVNDNVTSLRQAFPQECFMSVVDAEARGIKNGDTVLMTSPHGKVLRHAKVTPYIVPGAVAMQDGAWFEIDEETGIDLGGCPNVLQAPKSSGGGCQAWTGTLLQVEKYDGPLTLEADWARPVVTPVGIAE